MLLRSTTNPTHASLIGRYGAELARVLDRGQAELALSQGRRLEKLDALMRNIVQQSFDGILSVRENGRISTANEAANRIFGCPPEAMVGRHLMQLLPDLDQYRPSSRAGSDADHLEGLAKRSDGSTFPVELSLRPTVVDNERLLIAIVRDITNAKEQEEKLRYQALHDPLTGLPNRSFLKTRLDRALVTAERREQPLALLLFDLDRFKAINDTLGHHVGDVLLTILAQRVRTCVRKADTIARLGGDEFAILLPAPSDLDRAWFIATRIVDAMCQPFQIVNDLRLEVGVSIGIAMYPEHARDESRLMQCADVAMYAAKRSGRGIQAYDRAKDHNNVRDLTLSGALRQAIEGGALTFDFQPKLNLETGVIASFEALARWRQPNHPTIYPSDFVPQAEQTGLIQPLTKWSLDTALQQLAAWQEAGLDLSLAVNVSSRSLGEEELPGMVGALLEQWRVEPHRLTVELTESALMLDPEGVKTNLRALSDLGIRLSIDDFGTGFSSLSHLQRLPFHELKIDKSFVVHMLENEQDLVIVRSTIDLAHNLGMSVVAEGVESAAHQELLRELGCDLGQGFFIGEPLLPTAIDGWVDQGHWPVAGAKLSA